MLKVEVASSITGKQRALYPAWIHSWKTPLSGARDSDCATLDDRSRPLSLSLITSATKDRQSRILGEARIAVRKFAAIERRSSRGMDTLRVRAVETQSNALPLLLSGAFCHIPQDTASRNSDDRFRYTYRFYRYSQRSIERKGHVYGFPGSGLRSFESAAILKRTQRFASYSQHQHRARA